MAALGEYSMIYSEHDAPSRPSERLIDLAMEATRTARRTDLSDIVAKVQGRFTFPDQSINVWPGMHYRLLAGLIQALNPGLAVEIGTAQGLSALAMLKYLAPDSRLVTFDVCPWTEDERTCLTQADFASGKLTQVVDDLAEPETFSRYSGLLSQADFFFVDGPKDGRFEPQFICQMKSLGRNSNAIALFDDTRLWNMLKVWRELPWPKLDLTSFGSWCGSGLAEISSQR